VFGYVAGTLVALVMGVIAAIAFRGRTSLRGLLSRLWPSLVPPLLVVVGILALAYGGQTYRDLQARIGSRTGETARLAAQIRPELPTGSRWRSQDFRAMDMRECGSQVSATRSEAATAPHYVGPALVAIAEQLDEQGWVVRRSTVTPRRDFDDGLRLRASKGSQSVLVEGERTSLDGRLWVTAYAGDCLSTFSFRTQDQYDELSGGWSIASITMRFPAAERIEAAFEASRLPDGHALVYNAPSGSRWSGCPGATDAHTFDRSARTESSQELFDWYVERSDALEAAGWEVAQARFVDGGPGGFDVEHWQIWAVREDVAISLLARFQQADFQAFHRVYIAPCIAERGVALMDQAEWVSFISYGDEPAGMPLDAPPDLDD